MLFVSILGRLSRCGVPRSRLVCVLEESRCARFVYPCVFAVYVCTHRAGIMNSLKSRAIACDVPGSEESLLE